MLTRPFRRALRAVTGAAACRLLASLTLVATLGGAAALTSDARAQFGAQSSFAEAFQPDFLPRDMTTFNDYLSLEDWQRPIVEMLLEDYNDSFRAGVDSVRDEMRAISERIQGGSNANVMDLVMGPVQTWMAEKRRLADGFLSNVRSQLSDRQRDQWPAFERALRRDKSLPRGELSGESVNMVVLLRGMPLDAEIRESIQPTVDRYTIRLDEALQARENVIRSVEDRLAAAMRDMDFNAGLAASDQIMAARVAVRTIQDQSATEIEQALPTSYRADFRNRHRMAAYSKVFRSGGQMDRFFEAVRAIDNLRPDQIASINSIETNYWEQIESINGQMVDAIREEEPTEARRRTEAIRARHEGRPVPTREPARSSQLMVERDAIGDQTRKAIMALLEQDQLAQLPSHAKSRLTPADLPAERRGAVAPLGTGAPPSRGADDAERRKGAEEGRPGFGTTGGREQRGADERGGRQPQRALD